MKKKKNLKLLSNLLIILIIILLLLILINLKFWKYLEKKEIKEVILEDRCSILFSNIIHSIKDESGCENYCMAECSTREMKFYDTEFSLSLDNCNTCICYCK